MRAKLQNWRIPWKSTNETIARRQPPILASGPYSGGESAGGMVRGFKHQKSQDQRGKQCTCHAGNNCRNQWQRNWRPPRVRGSAAKQTKDFRSHDHFKHAGGIGFGCFISVRSHNAEVFAGIISSDNSKALPACLASARRGVKHALKQTHSEISHGKG